MYECKTPLMELYPSPKTADITFFNKYMLMENICIYLAKEYDWLENDVSSLLDDLDLF